MATIFRRSRSSVWQARLAGGERRSTGEANRAKALEKAQAFEREQLEKIVDPNDLRFKAAFVQFSVGSRLKPKTLQEYERSFHNIYEKWGDFSMKSLDDSHIKTYIQERKFETGHVMILRDLAFLSTLFTKAKNYTGGPQVNPLRGFSRKEQDLYESKGRSAYLKAKEIDRLLAACTKPYQKLFIILAVDSGMRSGEILRLDWDEIDLVRGEIELRGHERTKTGENRIVVLSARVRSALNSTPEAKRVGYVFRARQGAGHLTSFKVAWAGIQKRAKLTKRYRIHDLRHTFASWAAQTGIRELTTQAMLGHKTNSMTKRYSHLNTEAMHDAMKRIEERTLGSTSATDFVPSEE